MGRVSKMLKRLISLLVATSAFVSTASATAGETRGSFVIVTGLAECVGQLEAADQYPDAIEGVGSAKNVFSWSTSILDRIRAHWFKSASDDRRGEREICATPFSRSHERPPDDQLPTQEMHELRLSS